VGFFLKFLYPFLIFFFAASISTFCIWPFLPVHIWFASSGASFFPLPVSLSSSSIQVCLVSYFFSLAHSFTRSLILYLNIAQASSASQGQIVIHPNPSGNIRVHAGGVNRSLNIGTPPPSPWG
jgi:hypothetical protein